MPDLNDCNHWFGGDLILGPTGDLGRVSGTDRGRQRVLRRLCTNEQDYMQHPTYGGGLPGKVGSTLAPQTIGAICEGQMQLEDAVAQSPRPQVSVKPIPLGASVSVRYVDAPSKQPVALDFTVAQ